MTKAKLELEQFLKYGGYGTVRTEYVFHPHRKWRADFFLPEQNPPVMIEYDGLMQHGFNQGHASIRGILRDVEKLNAAAAMGIRVFRCNAKNWQDGTFADLLDNILERITWQTHHHAQD